MRHGIMRAGLLAIILAGPTVAADDPPRRSLDVTLPGLKKAGSVLLPNGWSLKPAGRQSALGDLPVILAENPKEPVLAVLHAGYGEHEVWTIDADTGRTIARTALPASFSGLVWSTDGARLFVGGGFDDVVYAFDHKDGLLSNKVTFAFGEKAAQRVPAGLAVSTRTVLWPSVVAMGLARSHSLASWECSENYEPH